MKYILALYAFLAAQTIIGAAPAPKQALPPLLACKTKAEAASLSKNLTEIIAYTNPMVFYKDSEHNHIVRNILHDALNVSYTEQEIQKLNATNIIKLIKVNNEYAGFIAFNRISNDEAIIEWLVIRKKFQGQKLGSALLSNTVSFMKKTGIKKINLTAQQDAANFYLKKGFVIEDAETFDMHYIF